MYRKIYLNILVIILIGTGILILLLILSPPLPNQQNNGFNRIWVKNSVELLTERKTDIPLESICGATYNHIFLSSNNPRCLIRQNYGLTKFDSIFFPVNLTPKVLSTRQFAIDSPWVYLFIINEPGFIYGKIFDSIVREPRFTKTKQLFIQSAYVSPSTVVIRTFDSLQTKQVFQKIYSHSGQILAQNTIIENQQDRGFGSGGIFKYDSTDNLLVYVQFYQNNVITIDTNLIVKKRFNTIDTTFSNETQIKQAKIDGVEKIVPAKARVSVNKNASVADGKLYIISGLRADNESIKAFNSNSVIDVYQVKNGNYIGSFYIPNLGGDRIRSFLVKKNRLVALYPNSVAVFAIPQVN